MRVLIFRNLENQNPHKYEFQIIYFIFHCLLCIYSTREIKFFKKVSNYYFKSLISQKIENQKSKNSVQTPHKGKIQIN